MLQITVDPTDGTSIKTALDVIKSERVAAMAYLKSLDERAMSLQQILRTLPPAFKADLTKPPPWESESEVVDRHRS